MSTLYRAFSAPLPVEEVCMQYDVEVLERERLELVEEPEEFGA